MRQTIRWWCGVLAAASVTSAVACDCADKYLNATNGKEKAAYVFSGDPVAKQGHYGDMLYTFRVESVWKGTLLKQAYMHGGMDSCGFAFRVGTSYLVFAHAGRGTAEEPLRTSICASNKELSGATAEVKQLGKPLTMYDRDKFGMPTPARPAPTARPAPVFTPAPTATVAPIPPSTSGTPQRAPPAVQSRPGPAVAPAPAAPE